MRIRKSLIAVALGLTLLLPVHASSNSSLPEFEQIRTQQAQIRVGVQSGTGIYKDMTSTDRDRLLQSQSVVLTTIEGKSSAADLTENQRIEVFNSLEQIEAIINKAEDDRVVCQKTTTVGSNRKTRVCATVAEMRAARERARDELDRSSIQTTR